MGAKWWVKMDGEKGLTYVNMTNQLWDFSMDSCQPKCWPWLIVRGLPQIVISATQIPPGTTKKACQDDPTAKDAIQEITAALHGKWSNQCRCTNCELVVNDGMTIIKFSIFRAIFLSPSDCWMTFVIPFTSIFAQTGASGRRMAASKRLWKPCRKGWRLAEFNLLWRGFLWNLWWNLPVEIDVPASKIPCFQGGQCLVCETSGSSSALLELSECLWMASGGLIMLNISKLCSTHLRFVDWPSWHYYDLVVNSCISILMAISPR